MSGTSIDGVDAALVRIAGAGECQLVKYVCRPYSPAEREEILRRASEIASMTRFDLIDTSRILR